MFIHIGNRQTVSDKNSIGIFNTETLRLSEINDRFCKELSPDDKSVVVSADNSVIYSKVSSFTIIKRTTINNDFIWRKGHD